VGGTKFMVFFISSSFRHEELHQSQRAVQATGDEIQERE
jgi:hypothetical protein